MRFFSPTQQSIYESAWEFIAQRLERILELSKTDPSKEAFFFVLRVMQQHNTEVVQEIINVFYTEQNQIIKNFLSDLNAWIKAENNNSRFIKAVTEPRLRTAEQQSVEYTEALQKEFAQHVTVDLQKWSEEKAPAHFYETKYSLLCAKYSQILHPHAHEAQGQRIP